eukprot:g15671.t1
MERAGFAVFLRAVGAVERGVAVPGTPEDRALISDFSQDTNCFLTHAELSLLCARMCGSWTPVVEVTPDFHASEETGDHTMLALAAEGVPTLEAMPDNQEQEAEALREAGWRLYEQGFRLITAEPVAEGRPSCTAAPSFEDLRRMRPLIIHLGASAEHFGPVTWPRTHYFLLESVEDVPESLNMEEAGL